MGRWLAFIVPFLWFTDNPGEFHTGDLVPVYVNKVGNYNNPAETYRYFSLPFCRQDEIEQHPEQHPGRRAAPGAALAGDRSEESGIHLPFNTDQTSHGLCTKTLDQNQIKQFRDAIEEDYVFEWFIDGLPIQSSTFLGKSFRDVKQFDDHAHDDARYFLYTHYEIQCLYNGLAVISCTVGADMNKRAELKFGAPLEVEFTYSTSFEHTSVLAEDRMMFHQQSAVNKESLQIHWLSIINSFVLVILLTSFLGLILMRILRNDFSRYLDRELDEEIGDEIDDSGWKMVHGDIFRAPEHPMLFSAAIGTGTQIFVMTVVILSLAILGAFYPGSRGTLYKCAIFLYAVTAGLAGYVASRLYSQLGGLKWASLAVMTASMFAGPFFSVFAICNTFAIAYGATTALPFGTIFLIIVLWAIVTFPLTVLGSSRGRTKDKMDVPCKTNRAQREIPPSPWYKDVPVQIFVAGFLPFTSIYIELHYIFASVWGHRTYTLFGILGLAFIMLSVVTAFITIAMTYFQLTSEDWRWWWRSVLNGGSCGMFVFAYALFFYAYRSDMSGMLQTSFFFGYIALLSYAFCLMMGAVGFWGSLSFTKHIYAVIKSD